MVSRPIEDIHDNFTNHRGDMMKQMDNMHKDMFKGFGGGMGMMMRDPFKDDPFFNGSDDMFGNANNMMAQM